MVIATSVIKALQRPLEFTQYVSIRHTERLAEAGIEPSAGRVGDSYDNALAESVIGLYKTELIRRHGPWRTADDVEYETLRWVDWFNTRSFSSRSEIFHPWNSRMRSMITTALRRKHHDSDKLGSEEAGRLQKCDAFFS